MATTLEFHSLEFMPVKDGNLKIVELLRDSGIIPAGVADELTREIELDYDGFDMYFELERVLDLPFILEGPSFVVWESLEDWEADNDYDY